MDDYTICLINDDGSIKTVQLPIITTRRPPPPENPSEWFSKHPHKKPPLFVPRKIDDLDVWERMLGHALEDSISPNVALRFMYEYIQNAYSERLTSEWRSYGVVIGKSNELVTPLSLLQVKENDVEWTAPENANLNKQQKFRLFAILIAGYRYGLASEIMQAKNYKTMILGKINQVLRNNPYKLNSDLTLTEVNRCKSWYNNLEFRAMIASLDMFWNKFPNSYGAKLRVCTLNSRFKDCCSISELRHLSEVSSKEVTQILQYCFSIKLKDEILAIARPGEENIQYDSYFPYMKDMRLSKKSPYSSSNNILLHHWVAMIGTLLGSDRLFNARIVSEYGLLDSMNSALFVAYAFKKYKSADNARTTEALSKEHNDNKDVVIDPASPLGVYHHIMKCNNMVPREIIEMFSQVVNKMGTPRDKTIGMFLKRNLITFN